MTGRELIIYILEKDLVDEELALFAENNIVGLLTVDQAAKKFHVGEATIKVWYGLNMLNGVEIGNEIYIFTNSELQNKEVMYG